MEAKSTTIKNKTPSKTFVLKLFKLVTISIILIVTAIWPDHGVAGVVEARKTYVVKQ